MLKTISSFLSTCFFFAVIALILVITSVWQISQELPEYRQLERYEPKVTTRLYAGDGQLMSEYAAEKRLFVPEEKIPDLVKQAFISAEDKTFYSHFGIDFMGIARAVMVNIKNFGSGRRPTGASTITQQVAKNFLLSSELSYKRKIKEALLAVRIEQAFSKKHILELYLNEIYLGNRAYGVAAAAINYFNKSLDELTLEEIAYLAALPKGPNNYNPKTKYDAAIARRNWVIDRMVEDGYVTADAGEQAKAKPLVVTSNKGELVRYSQYFSEDVRRQVKKEFGEDALYEGGLLIRTTLNPKLQEIATKSFTKEIENYDKRHGWRGALQNITIDDNLQETLKTIEKPGGTKDNWQLAVVKTVTDDKADIELKGGEKGEIPLSVLAWARKTLKNQSVAGKPKKVSEVLAVGDVILVEQIDEKDTTARKMPKNSYYLRQLPNVEGALIAMNPHTGKIEAMVGGYSFQKSQYNRATQAKRQTGSSFKPIVYLTALENGYEPTDLILDAPFVLDQGFGQPLWKPVNYSKKFYGLMTLRQGIEKSRNLMTVRLAQDVGMDKVADMAKKMGVNNDLPQLLSMSLGAGETKLINMASAYSMMVNGGKKVEPYLIERIQNRKGLTLYKHDVRECPNCSVEKWENQEVPQLSDNREQIIDPLSAYQMVSILEGVVQQGTGARLRSLGKHLAGKTGTTNKNQDAWFVGFSPDLVVAVYVGFDNPKTLGKFETGAAAALPIFYDFMYKALQEYADVPFRIPSGIKLVRINHKTGKPATPNDDVVIWEALKPEMALRKAKQKVIGQENATTVDTKTKENVSPIAYEDTSEDEIQLGGEY
ncbi:MAG: penicillin-binding protein 1A [Alphaproteobacteria bacterium]|nr:penicillin-binding protein 1A [Alphaproteobacteria bacterium]